MLKIGITGLIGTGKSRVLKMFAENGIPGISADELIRSFQSPGNILWQHIRKRWGKVFFKEDGELNREKISDGLIRDPVFKKELEDLAHPLVRTEMLKIFNIWENEGKECAAAEVPLLFQAGWENMFDITILTKTRPDIQAERIMNKRKISRSKAEKWIYMQSGAGINGEKADIVLDTSVPPVETEKKVREIIRKIKEEKQ